MSAIDQARRALERAEALVVSAGAGMGVDSGLPDFRGDEGFWRAYPPLKHLGLSFSQMANPAWFSRDPALAWGFYGHRLHLYRDTPPHAGFGMLRELGARLPNGAFVFTSNVDGAFERAGFAPEQILECHGSIHHMQCVTPCHEEIWSAEGTNIDLNPQTFRASEPLPRCPRCGALARPNILMFGDGRWLADRAEAQERAFARWWERAGQGPVVVLEFGAGKAVPSVRRFSEQLKTQGSHVSLVRVNPREADGPTGTISLELGALEATRALLAQS
jgi:NAD-dependent SIR2 family protein deacetylase